MTPLPLKSAYTTVLARRRETAADALHYVNSNKGTFYLYTKAFNFLTSPVHDPLTITQNIWSFGLDSWEKIIGTNAAAKKKTYSIFYAHFRVA